MTDTGQVAATVAISGAAPARCSMYCRRCGYALVGLPENRCPECGRAFDPANPKSYLANSRQWTRRRWLRRILLAGVCLAALAVADLLCLYLPWRREQALIPRIQQSGGNVQLNDSQSAWVQALIGPRRYHLRIERVNLTGYYGKFREADLVDVIAAAPELRELDITYTQLTSDAYDRIGRVKGLRSLSLCETKTTDADLARLKGLTGLERLYVGSVPPNPRITDAGMARLAGMTRLKNLELQSAGVSDAGLAHLEGLVNLEFVNLLTCQRVKGPGLVHLQKLPRLHILDLRGTQVDDAGLANLAGMTQLQSLGAGHRITDAGIQHIATLTGLSWLDLSGSPITEKGLESLRGLTALGGLYLNNTKVSEEAIGRLKAAMPKLDVHGPGPLVPTLTKPGK